MASTPLLSRSTSWRRGAPVGFLAALAFLPPLLTAPGVVAADTKQYLTLDPGRLMSTAASLWDPQQFGGYVTHQTVGYLWPLGPYYWVCERLGFPDWVAQRLWLGILFLAAGSGVLRLGRRFGLDAGPALAAAVLYQLTPYVATYANRTSVLLAPWAGLGWILLFTMRAARDRSWRWPCAIALVVLTIGSINATSLVLLALAPLLWLAFAVQRGDLSTGEALRTVARVAGPSIAVSLWWVVALALQGRYGADVLAYSETVQAVSSTSSAAEIQRGLGYWLFYGTTGQGPWNAASTGYLANPGLMALGWSIFVLGVVGAVVTRHRERPFLAMMWLIGTLVAVGAYPIENPTLYGRLLTADTAAGSLRENIVLALRSSTRATPLVALAASLSLGLLLARLEGNRLAKPAVAGVLAMAVLNLPPLWNGTLVDPILRRPAELPIAWQQLVADLDREGNPGAGSAGRRRVLELPGQEFAAFTWGTTTDQPLPGLGRHATITRDLLPLGDPQRMDLLFALDDRIQNGTLDPASLAPIARLLGATDIVFRLDADNVRYGTPTRDDIEQLVGRLADDGGLELSHRYPTSEGRDSPSLVRFRVIGTPDPVRVLPDQFVLVEGSGDGLIDAAAAKLLNGTELIRYAGDAPDPETLADWAARAVSIIVTDSNRRRAHHWRGSQDVVGFTEDIDTAPLRRDIADVRLPTFSENIGPAGQTIGDQRGGTVRATSYGPGTAYRPEDRPWYAADANPVTFWQTGADGPVEGERLEVRFDQPVQADGLVVRQPAGERLVTQLRVQLDDREIVVVLDERSWSPDGQALSLPGAPTQLVAAEVLTTEPGRLPSYLGQPPIGLDITVPGGQRIDEIVRVPQRVASVSDRSDISIVTARERVDKAGRVDASPNAHAQPPQRRDPEQTITRSFALPAEATVRLSGDVTLPDAACRDDLVAIDGSSVGVRIADGRFEACSDVALQRSEHLLTAAKGVDSVVLVPAGDGQIPLNPSSTALSATRQSSTELRVDVIGVAEPTVVVVDEGWNEGWAAVGLGDFPVRPTRVNAGSMAWLIPPGAEPVSFTISWRPQRLLAWSMIVSLMAAVLCAVMVALGRRREVVPAQNTRLLGLPGWCAAVAVTGLFAVVARPSIALAVGVLGVLAAVGQVRLVKAAAVLAALATGLLAVFVQLRRRPLPGFGWVQAHPRPHAAAMVAVAALAIVALTRHRRDDITHAATPVGKNDSC